MNRPSAALLTLLLLTASVVDASTFGLQPSPEAHNDNGLSRHAGRSAPYITTAGTVCAWNKHPAPQRCLVALDHDQLTAVLSFAADRHFLRQARVQPRPAFVRPASSRAPPPAPSSVV